MTDQPTFRNGESFIVESSVTLATDDPAANPAPMTLKEAEAIARAASAEVQQRRQAEEPRLDEAAETWTEPDSEGAMERRWREWM